MSAGEVFGMVSLLSVLIILAALRTLTSLGVLTGYLLAILIYGYDKLISGRGWTRVPEKVLHSLAFFGGSPGALIAMLWFRHKTVKGSFRAMYWAIVFLQVALLIGYWWWRSKPHSSSSSTSSSSQTSNEEENFGIRITPRQ